MALEEACSFKSLKDNQCSVKLALASWAIFNCQIKGCIKLESKPCINKFPKPKTWQGINDPANNFHFLKLSLQSLILNDYILFSIIWDLINIFELNWPSWHRIIIPTLTPHPTTSSANHLILCTTACKIQYKAIALRK